MAITSSDAQQGDAATPAANAIPILLENPALIADLSLSAAIICAPGPTFPPGSEAALPPPPMRRQLSGREKYVTVTTDVLAGRLAAFGGYHGWLRSATTAIQSSRHRKKFSTMASASSGRGGCKSATVPRFSPVNLL
jgi:hypothetical protein